MSNFSEQHSSHSLDRKENFSMLGALDLRIPIVNELATSFLRAHGSLTNQSFELQITSERGFSNASEHFAHIRPDCALIKDSFLDLVGDNTPLLACVVMHELYHGLKQGFKSYKEALEVIRGFSTSDIIRLDLEADRATYEFLSQTIGLSFDDYCEKVMLPYPDLFGVQNKTFADFSRYCSKLMNFNICPDAGCLTDSLIMLAPNEAGWRSEGETMAIQLQSVENSTAKISSLRVPVNLVEEIGSVFWRNNRVSNDQLSSPSQIVAPIDSPDETASYVEILKRFANYAKHIG